MPNDDGFTYEGTIDTNSERGQRWMRRHVGAYVSTTAVLLRVLAKAGIPTDQVDEHHVELARQIVSQINSESRNAFEQAALTAMVGTSLLATFEAQLGFIELQMDIIDAEDGVNCDS